MSAREQISRLKQSMQRSIIGQEHIVERLIIGLLANGNILVEIEHAVVYANDEQVDSAGLHGRCLLEDERRR